MYPSHDALVTVGVPTLGDRDSVWGALASIEQQSCRELINVIILANGPENNDAIRSLHHYAGSLPKVWFVNSSTRLDGVTSLSRLMYLSKTRYTMWLADDDLISERYIEVLLNLLEGNPNAVSAAGTWRRIGELGGETLEPRVAYTDRSWATRAFKFLRDDRDDWFYGLHRTLAFRKARFLKTWGWLARRGHFSRAAYPFLLDLILRGTVVGDDSGSATWTNSIRGHVQNRNSSLTNRPPLLRRAIRAVRRSFRSTYWTGLIIEVNLRVDYFYRIVRFALRLDKN